MEDAHGLPSAAGDLASEHPAVWRAYSALGKVCADAGPIEGHTLRLVKLALAVGASLEGAVHSHARRGVSEGIEKKQLEHVALLATTTLGFPAAVRAVTWIRDVTDNSNLRGQNPTGGSA
jgi:alkylhydroperoxidase/carboxymuconolactone decarboxylase family protein YurZ